MMEDNDGSIARMEREAKRAEQWKPIEDQLYANVTLSHERTV